MKDQHEKIIGYRDLTQEEIDLMNEVKEMGKKLDDLTKRVNDTPNIDRRWVAIAVTELQQGLMALTRSIARPTTF